MDNVNCYTYDGENRISSVGPETTFGSGVCGASTMSYLYDPDGKRVARVQNGAIVKQDYYDAAGHEIAETNGSGTLLRAEIYGARHLATWSGNATYFNHADWLGTERVRTNSSGTVCETITSLPFGDGEATSGSCSPTPTFFTGKERDTESGNDYFGARYYGSSLGRFVTPDPAGEDATELEDPQSWNAYVYVRNDPTTLTDPEGTDYIVCTNDQNASQTCTRVTDDKAFEQALQNPGEGITIVQTGAGAGNIYTTDANGQQVLSGNYQWVPPTQKEEATVDATDNLINLASLPFIVRDAYLGIRSAVSFGRGMWRLIGDEGSSNAGFVPKALIGPGKEGVSLTQHALERALKRGICQQDIDEAVATAKAAGDVITQTGKYGTAQQVFTGKNNVVVVVETAGRNAGKAITVWRK